MENLLITNNLILIICTIVMLVLFFVVFRHGNRKVSNNIFSIFVLTAIVWILTNLMANLALYQNNNILLFWTKVSILGPTFMPILLILFANSFPENKITLKKTYIWILSLITLGIIFLIPTSYNVQSVQITNAAAMESVFNPGILYTFFSIYLLFGIGVTVIILIEKYIKSSRIEKLQIKNVLIGLVISILLGILLSAVLPIFGFSQFINIGPASTIFFIIFTAFAIIKYQLLDVKLIIAETVTYLVLTVLLIEMFFSTSIMEGLLRLLFLVIMGYGGYVLIDSMHREIKQKEQLQQLSDQLEHANEHLKELDQMKTEFVSLASHELLTPVSAIEGYLSMILDEHLAKVDDPKAAQYLDRIYRSSRRLARLIADMLNISRIEEGRLLVEKKDVDLSAAIKQVIEEVRFKAQENHQQLVFKNPDGWKTYGDPDKIKEILVNLIGNSIKYSKNPGTITIEVKEISENEVRGSWNKIEDDIKTRPLDDQEAIKSAVDPHFRELVGEKQIMISIKDQGVGIPAEELPRLFKKFHRVGDFTIAESQGTGLGLYISRALVELHHGRIWAESDGPGKGSTFIFTLPDISAKDEIMTMEQEIDQNKEQMKPLARPMGKALEEI